MNENFIYLYCFRYCQSSAIRKVASNKNIKVIFKSDRKTSGTGAQCTIECIDPTTITFTGLVHILCSMQLYMIDMSENNFILALSSCPVKDTSCVAADGNNIVNSTAAADSELDCGSMYLHKKQFQINLFNQNYH